MSLPIESFAKSAALAAAGVVSTFSPLGGVVLQWATAVAFEIYDREKAGSNPVAVAQYAADRVVDLIEDLKTRGS